MKNKISDDEFLCRRFTNVNIKNNKINYSLFMDKNNELSVDRSYSRSDESIMNHEIKIFKSTTKKNSKVRFCGFVKLSVIKVKELSVKIKWDPTFKNRFHSLIMNELDDDLEKRINAKKMCDIGIIVNYEEK